MKFLWISVAVCALGLLQHVSGDLPADIQGCHHGDAECMRRATADILKKYAKSGIRSLNLPSFDPLRIKLFQLERNQNSPVNIELKFKDVDLAGLQNCEVIKVTGFEEDLKKSSRLEVMCKKVTFNGPYTIDGSVLILPIRGSGPSTISFSDTHLTAIIKHKEVIKNGKTYMQIESIKLDLVPKSVTYQLNDLFNGNKELSDSMNLFINQNWKEIFEELKPAICKALALVFQAVLNNVFVQQPYEDFFIH